MSDWPSKPTLSSPAAPNSAEPQLSTLIDRVVLSWVERAGDTATRRFAERTDGGWMEVRTSRAVPTGSSIRPDVPSVVDARDKPQV